MPPRFLPSVDFDHPPEFDKLGDRAEHKILVSLKLLNYQWTVFHGFEWRDLKKNGERIEFPLFPTLEQSETPCSIELMATDNKTIRVSTTHAFKGLEADVVLLAGINDHQKSCSPQNLYVGASRARSMLFIFHLKNWLIPKSQSTT